MLIISLKDPESHWINKLNRHQIQNEKVFSKKKNI